MKNKIIPRDLHYFKVTYYIGKKQWIIKLWGVDKPSVQERIEQLECQVIEKPRFTKMDTIRFFDMPFQKLNKNATNKFTSSADKSPSHCK